MFLSRPIARAIALVALLTMCVAADSPGRWVRIETRKDAERTVVQETVPAPEVTAEGDGGAGYVLVKADPATIEKLRGCGLKVSNATQTDFAHRFSTLTWTTDEQKAAVLAAGLDLIEFDGPRREALARVTDGEARRLRAKGVEVKLRADLDRLVVEAHTRTLAAPDAGAYHTYDEMRAEFDALVQKYPEQTKLHQIGTTVQGRKILALEVGDQKGGPDAERPQALVLGCHHAREWISVEIPLKLARELLDNPSHSADISALVKTARIWIVPIVNPDGHQYTVTTNRMWRKNLRENGDGTLGVDINRNYGGPEWATSPGSSTTPTRKSTAARAPSRSPKRAPSGTSSWDRAG